MKINRWYDSVVTLPDSVRDRICPIDDYTKKDGGEELRLRSHDAGTF